LALAGWLASLIRENILYDCKEGIAAYMGKARLRVGESQRRVLALDVALQVDSRDGGWLTQYPASHRSIDGTKRTAGCKDDYPRTPQLRQGSMLTRSIGPVADGSSQALFNLLRTPQLKSPRFFPVR
jgi:hypothetical protein